MRRVALLVLLVVNIPVWLGQVWPEGAPPFAREVNIAFLTGTFAFLLSELIKRPKAR
ncbi:MAG: hypothetical protein JNK82_13525 [Myxococcaceae bacterium]|nr:hypothetical protein [Myxococcaceae bacterium]